MKKQTKLGLVIAAAAVLTVSVASLVSARGWVQDGADWHYVDNDGEYVTETIQSSGNAKFYLDENGNMAKDYFLEDYNSNTYYFGSNGAMVTNTWVAIESGRVENQGEYVPDNYWYYFQASGKAMKGTNATPKKSTIDGKKYMFNEFGQMCTGWIKESGEVVNPDDENNPFKEALYYAGGDNDGVLRAGWVTYYDGYDEDDGYLGEKTNLYFYFNTTNNKKIGNANDGYVTKKINGKTYAFTDEGVMLSGWDVTDEVNNAFDSLKTKVVYFSGEDDGHQVKKGWVYAVPGQEVDTKAYGDGEEKYMYFNASGDIVFDTFKKINGKYYAFNASGIMKTGIVIWDPNAAGYTTSRKADRASTGDNGPAHFKGTIDTDWAKGEDVVKKGIWQTDSKDYITVNPEGWVISSCSYTNTTGDAKAFLSTYAYGADVEPAVSNTVQLKLHHFGPDGARKTGSNSVEFSDDVYTLNTTASGDKGSGVFSKKYYQFGILLKASSDLKYGIYVATVANQLKPQIGLYQAALQNAEYTVLNSSGSKQKGAWAAKKDADGNYWLIDNTESTLLGIWSVNVKYNTFTNLALKYQVKNSSGTYNVATLGQLAADAADYTVYNDNGVVMGTLADYIDKYAVVKSGNDFVKVDFSAGHKCGAETGCRWVYLTAAGDRALMYQTDFNGSSNKWIPFGVKNDARKTPSLEWVNGMPDAGHAYQITPNADYFVNAYWKN